MTVETFKFKLHHSYSVIENDKEGHNQSAAHEKMLKYLRENRPDVDVNTLRLKSNTFDVESDGVYGVETVWQFDFKK
jgi:hypothetical protein